MRWSNIFVSKPIAQKRYEVCKKCEHFNTNYTKCNICGCIMKIKVKISSSKCPIKKWEELS
jgi:hypothetical protein